MSLDDFSNNLFMKIAIMCEGAAKWARSKIIIREPKTKHLNTHNVT